MTTARAPRALGYVPGFSFDAGGVVPVHASGDGQRGEVALVRLDLPAGLSPVAEVPSLRTGVLAEHPMAPGSYARSAAGTAPGSGWTLSLRVKVTAWPIDSASIAAWQHQGGSVSVDVTSAGNMRLTAVDSAGTSRQSATPERISLHAWCRLLVQVDAAGVRAAIDDANGAQLDLSRDDVGAGATALSWWFGKAPAGHSPHNTSLDGRLARPAIWWGQPAAEWSVAPQGPPDLAWDLGADPGSAWVSAIGTGQPLELVNMPTRAVTGPDWDGSVHHWPADPEQWDAVHFHRDDLEDAGWPVVVELALPPELDAGLYAVELTSGETRDLVPFVVRSAAAARRPPVRVLLPTLTYLAYANEPVFSPHVPLNRDWWDDAAEELGLRSLYNWHDDGSGVAYASARRPLLNMRPDYRYWLTGCAHGLGADLALLRWLSARGTEFEVLTDHDLHARPVESLSNARCLITGSHPEYWSRRMMNGLEAYLADGGRLAYLGGNGFASLVGVHRERPHVMELRRRGNGPGLWDAGPGELSLATTGEQSGYWRHQSPTPRQLTGLDTAGMGFGPGAVFRRTSDSDMTEAAFVFEGVADREFGTEARVLGTAAAYEVDSADFARGTPTDTLILATAEGFVGYESLEQTGHIRADITLRTTAAGGGVFGVGSISWTSALDDPVVSRITGNVVDRFTDAEPLPRRSP